MTLLSSNEMPLSLTRRRLLTIGAAGAISAALEATGCSSQSGSKPTLRYMAWGNPEQLALEKATAAEFMKRNPGVDVEVFLVPGSAYLDKLQLMLASRTAPDVMRVDHYNFPALVRKEYFLPLTQYIAAEPKGFIDDFVPVALDECRYKGELYALNVLFGPTLMYYNKKLIAEAGLTDPYQLSKQGKWDWKTFVDYAVALTKRDSSGRSLQFGSSMPNYPQYSSIIWNEGGELMNPDITKMTLADDPHAVAGITDFANLRWKYRCAPTPADNSLSPFTFESGKIAMVWGWAGETPRYRKAIKTFDWDIAPTPSGPAGNWAVVKGNQITVNKLSRHPDLAYEFVKFMTGPETELRLCGKERRAVPTRLSVQNDPQYLDTKKPPFQTEVFLESVKRGRILPINWRYQEWVQVYNSAMDGLFNLGSETPEAACREATNRVNTLLRSEEGF